MLIRIGTLAVLGVLATCAPAIAAPATVDLRVEGASQTLHEGAVTTDGHAVTTQSGGTHQCDGTNGGANPSPGPTMTSALDDGARAAGFTFDGTYDSGFDDFFISRIGPDTNTGAPNFQPYWGLFVNWVASQQGGCQTRVAQGDRVQWLYSSFGQPLLELSGAPAKAAVGERFGVKVVQHDGNGNSVPAAGASVAGQSTSATGDATVSFDSPGTQRLKATRSDAVRSNALEVCIYRPGSGDCATVPDGPAGAPGGTGPVGRDSAGPEAGISGLVNGRRYRRGPRLLRGTASDNAGLFQVYMRLRKIARGGCRWFSTKRETFTKPRTCEHARFGRLGTEEKWSYLLPERLERGRYILEVKALDRSYNVDRDKVRFWVGERKAGSAASGPRVEQMVVFRDGSAKVRTVRASQTRVRVRGRRCGVASASPLAALLRSRVARVRVRDFGSCSRRASDGGGLFVQAIGRDRNRRQDGWVYKVGHRLATAGAADPDGAFGNGRLRRGATVTWFFCRLENGTCQRTLSVEPASGGAGTLEVRVRSHDEEGRAQPAAGATVHVGALTATTGPDGIARVQAPAGRYRVYAEKAGEIRSLPERVVAG